MKRALGITAEIGIGIAFVGIAYFWATTAPDQDVPVKWLGLSGSTAILFGYPIYWAREKHKSLKFWSYWVIFLVLHLFIFIPVLKAVHQWPLVLFVFTTLLELAFINPILDKQLRIDQRAL